MRKILMVLSIALIIGFFAFGINYYKGEYSNFLHDGYQVLERCKEHEYYEELPIVVESGVEDTASLDKVNSYPIVGILLKPFKESDLRRVVEKSYATYF